MNRIPFDKDLYKEALLTAILVGLVGWVVLYIVFGELTTADIYGMLISIPIFAYLLHLLKQF
ncbi:MAG: hypothetical protein KJP00_05390 [Bacteroidia bacterium]|nr:hypothetical protein [Bacteroidia bacterium]